VLQVTTDVCLVIGMTHGNGVHAFTCFTPLPELLLNVGRFELFNVDARSRLQMNAELQVAYIFSHVFIQSRLCISRISMSRIFGVPYPYPLAFQMHANTQTTTNSYDCIDTIRLKLF